MKLIKMINQVFYPILFLNIYIYIYICILFCLYVDEIMGGFIRLEIWTRQRNNCMHSKMLDVVEINNRNYFNAILKDGK